MDIFTWYSINVNYKSFKKKLNVIAELFFYKHLKFEFGKHWIITHKIKIPH